MRKLKTINAVKKQQQKTMGCLWMGKSKSMLAQAETGQIFLEWYPPTAGNQSLGASFESSALKVVQQPSL